MITRLTVHAPCGFQFTFLECPPDHFVVVKHVWGWSREHAERRAFSWILDHGLTSWRTTNG